MPSLEAYRSELDYSYAPGVFPSMECLLHRPEAVRRLLVHSSAAGREGVGKLTALAEEHRIRIEEADRALGRISGKENCYAAAIIRPCVDVFDPRTVRASMGSLFRLRVRVYDSFEDYRADFPDRALYPFMLDASVPLREIREIPEQYSLVFGNEGSGLPAEFASMGQAVRIESNDKVDSLNLAVAAGVGIYYFSSKGV